MSDPVSVLFVNTRSALGADVAVHLQLVRHLDPARTRVAIATNSRSVDLSETLRQVANLPADGVHVLNLGYEVSGRSRAGRVAGVAGNLAVLAAAVPRLAALVRKHGAQVIHTTDRPRDALVGSWLARLTHRHHVMHFHIKWYENMGGATERALARCSGAIAISDFVARSLVDGGVEPRRVHKAYNGTDPAEFDPALHCRGRLRATLGVPADAPLVGIFARIMVWKGQAELIEAFAQVRRRLPDARLLVVGREDALAGGPEGGYLQDLRARVGELGLQGAVHWTGWSDDVAGLMADTDVVCVPSREEPFGLVVTEAMCMQRPVVGFCAGALPEIIEDGVHGRLVPPYEIGALAEALCEMLGNPGLRAEMGRRGRERVMAAFTPQHSAAAMSAIYERVCGREAR